MKNSIFPIKDRVYFLKNSVSYEEYRFHETPWSTTITRGKTSIPLSQAKKHIEDEQILNQFTKLLVLPYEKDAWNHAPHDMRQALVMSYVFHQENKNNKVANIETINWRSIPYFQNLHKQGKKQTSFFWILPHFRTWFNFVTMTNGNHLINLRLGRIHMTEELLDGKQYSCIHWDIGASRFSRSLIAHWLFDDMSS